VNVIVIVDMQAAYLAAQDRALIARIEATAATIAKKGRVVLVCYDGSGPQTVCVEGADILWKDSDDGGLVVYSWLVGAGLVNDDLHVTVCGVNLCACVYRTAAGLGARLFDEHALCDHVSIDTNLCGDGSKFRVRFKQ
jgi:hypothetical protein